MRKIMNHSEYMKKVKRLSEDQLRFILSDARSAINAMPDGENAGYYQDEIHYAAMELQRRIKKERK